MSYTSIMVHLQLGRAHDWPLKLAADLAERFDARLIVVSETLPVHLIFGGGDRARTFLADGDQQILPLLKPARRATQLRLPEVAGAPSGEADLRDVVEGLGLHEVAATAMEAGGAWGGTKSTPSPWPTPTIWSS